MNVCMISGYQNFLGGLENVVNELENFLIKHNIGVTVYRENQSNFLPRKLQTLFYSRSNYHKILYSFRTLLSTRYNQFDIIHGHGDNCFGSFLLRGDTPFVMTFHGAFAVDCRGQIRKSDPRVIPSLYAEKIAATRCDIAVACSKAVKEEIRRFYGKNKIAVIYNGVDTKKFMPKDKEQARRKFNLPSSKCYALWVGRDPVGKGLPTVLRTLKDYPEIHLLIVGTKIFPNAKNVTCLGRASLSCLVDAYNASDFLFFPTLYEGFPLVPMEAMACGLPILVSKASNMGEIITSGKHGFVVENGDYRDKVELLLADEELRRKMSANCRDLALQYSWAKQAEKYLELYRSLLN